MRKEELTKVLAVLLLSVIILLFVLYSSHFNITGKAIFQTRPNASEGKDTYIRENVDTNYGDGETIKIGKSGGGQEFRSLIEFNISSIPESHTITSAVLRLHLLYSSSSNNITAEAHALAVPWEEQNATWYNRTSIEQWSQEGGSYYSEVVESKEISTNPGWYNFSIDSVVRKWVNGSLENNGLIIVSPDASTGDYKDIDSSDSTDTNLRPELIIEHEENAPPTILNLTTNSKKSNPLTAGEEANFTVNWSDLEGDDAQIYVCNSSNITYENGCEDKLFCNTSLSQKNPVNCSYTTKQSDNTTEDFFLKICDPYNCSSVTQDKIHINHPPNVTLNQPNENETINQSQGNYTIDFTVSDDDPIPLTANLYYSEVQNGTDNLIVSDLNLTENCNDFDLDLSTPNDCTYSWNTSGIYGNYYMTVYVDDNYTMTYDSSDGNFTVVSMKDEFPPNITSQWLSPTDLHSGEQTTFYANVSDNKLVENVWVSVDDSQNITMTNISQDIYAANWTSTTTGNHQFKVYAEDRVGNVNDTLPWQTFSVDKPLANPEDEYSPSEALPYHTIKISGELNSTDSLKDVDAYLNTPEGFDFLEDYPRNLNLGDFSYNETKTAVWFLSAPFSEENYTMNITYSDPYGNTWQSSNFNTEITSALGDYSLDLEGYTYVVGGDDYYAEATFKQSGEYVSPGSIEISLYDAAGNLVVDSVSMNEMSTGKYNYTYQVPSSAVEGSWETRINVTEGSESYHTNEFWRVVGGPFDVRNIQVVDSETEDLEIDVDVENTGDLDKDFYLEWNLTQENNGTVLDSGGETFMVPANSVRNWTVNPSTTYTGEVRITFLGTDVMSGQKAGAYQIFTTTEPTEEPTEPAPSPGGGGGGGDFVPSAPTGEADIEADFEPIVNLGKGISKTINLNIENTGSKVINDLTLKIQGLDQETYEIVPEEIGTLSTEKTKRFNITFSGKEIGETNFNYAIISNQINKTYSGKLVVTNLKQYLLDRINELEEIYNELKNKLLENEEHELVQRLDKCKTTLDSARTDVNAENYIEARDKIDEAEDCINKIRDKFEKSEEKLIEFDYSLWIIGGGALFVMVLIIIVIIIYKTYKKFNIMTFLKKETKSRKPQKKEKTPSRDIDQKIKDIKEKLGKTEED